MNLRLKWVYFIRRFQNERRNGKFAYRSQEHQFIFLDKQFQEFRRVENEADNSDFDVRSLNQYKFENSEYQDLLNEVMTKQTVTYSELSALYDEVYKEIKSEMKRRGGQYIDLKILIGKDKEGVLYWLDHDNVESTRSLVCESPKEYQDLICTEVHFYGKKTGDDIMEIAENQFLSQKG